MEPYTLVVSTEPGKEKRVLRDVLDLLFPYDSKVEGDYPKRGRVIIRTRLPPERLVKLFLKYPIRGLLNVRLVISVYQNLDIMLCRIAIDLCRLDINVEKIRVKIKHGWRQEYYSKIKNILSRRHGRKNGLEILIEEFDGKIALEVFLFRPQYASFNVQAKI